MISAGLTNTVRTATHLRRANIQTYLDELDALIVLDADELNGFRTGNNSHYFGLQFTKTYYATFELPTLEPLRALLSLGSTAVTVPVKV